MISQLVGTWVLDESKNFDEFMKEVGVGLILRKAGNMTVPTLIIDIENEKWSVKIRSTFKNSDDEFFIGVEKDDVTMDNRFIKAIRRIEGNTLVTEQRDRSTGKLQVTIVTEVGEDGRLVEKLTCNNVTALRFYKRK